MEMQEPSDWRQQTERQTVSNRLIELSITQLPMMLGKWAGSHGKDSDLIGRWSTQSW